MPRPSRISHFASAQSPQRTNSALPGFRFGCLKQPSRVLNSPAQSSCKNINFNKIFLINLKLNKNTRHKKTKGGVPTLKKNLHKHSAEAFFSGRVHT
jgi:hypothetical protein